VEITSLGKMLVVLGAVTVFVGLALVVFGRLSFFGHLPGDIAFRRGNVSCHIPIVSSLLLSLLLTIVLNLVLRWLNR
jgi:hypothetical protein